MVADNLLVGGLMFQVNVFHVVYHMGGASKATSALLIRILFVPNANYTLRLVADEGDLKGGGEGAGRGLSSFTVASQTGEGRRL
jgi:hypothetical protein